MDTIISIFVNGSRNPYKGFSQEYIDNMKHLPRRGDLMELPESFQEYIVDSVKHKFKGSKALGTEAITIEINLSSVRYK